MEPYILGLLNAQAKALKALNLTDSALQLFPGIQICC